MYGIFMSRTGCIELLQNSQLIDTFSCKIYGDWFFWGQKLTDSSHQLKLHCVKKAKFSRKLIGNISSLFYKMVMQ